MFFFVHINGGDWAEANRGVAADSVGGYARAWLCSEWCVRFEFPVRNSFALTCYGREGGNELAREYCRRGHYFLKLWLDGGDAFWYEQAHLDSYVESPEFASLVARVPETHS